MAWILRLVKTGAEGDGPSTDVMEINKPDDLRDIAHLGLNLAEAKLLLANLQQEIVAAQAKTHAVVRPDCLCGSGVRHVKDYREHAVATLFGRVMVRLPRFRCAACGTIEVGIDWGRVPARGVRAVGKWPAGATVQSLTEAGHLPTAVVIADLR